MHINTVSVVMWSIAGLRDGGMTIDLGMPMT